MARSPDGRTWTVHRVADIAVPFASVAWGAGLFAATEEPCSSHGVGTSPDGWDWTWHDTGGSARWIAYGAGQFVVVGSGGFTASSPDGATWTPHDSGTTTTLTDLLWDGSRFLAAGQGVVTSSGDGQTWVSSPTGLGSSLKDMLLEGGLYLALADDPSRIVHSSDGLTWSDLLVPGQQLYALAAGGGVIAAVVDGGILASADGLHWTWFPVGWSIADLAWAGDGFVAVGWYRTIVYASCFGTFAALDPPGQQIRVDQEGHLTLTLSEPVTGDTTVALGADPAGVVALPGSVTVAAGGTQALIPVRGLAEGTATVNATLPQALGGGSTSATVEVLPGGGQGQGTAIPALSGSGQLALALLIAGVGAGLLARWRSG